MMRFSSRAGSLVDPTPTAMSIPATDPPKPPADLSELTAPKNAELIDALLSLLAEFGGVHGALG